MLTYSSCLRGLLRAVTSDEIIPVDNPYKYMLKRGLESAKLVIDPANEQIYLVIRSVTGDILVASAGKESGYAHIATPLTIDTATIMGKAVSKPAAIVSFTSLFAWLVNVASQDFAPPAASIGENVVAELRRLANQRSARKILDEITKLT